MSTHNATPSPSLPDVRTFLSDLASTLQGRSLSDLPHVTFRSGTFILVALPVNIARGPAQQQATTYPAQPETGEDRRRKSRRQTEAQTSGPTEIPANMTRINQSMRQLDEGNAYNTLCDIIDGYSDLSLDQKIEPQTSDASSNTVKPSASGVKSFKKPTAKTSAKRKTRCIATQVDESRCKYKARVGFQTCGLRAHRQQDPEYESSDEAFSDSDA